jgi:hypothetical protein
MPFNKQRRKIMATTRNCKENITQNKTGLKRRAVSTVSIPVAKSKMLQESKQEMLIKLLKRPGGATVEEMAKSIGWQRHSIRGMMSGILKKQLGLSIASEKEERGRIYRIAAI